jgi:site-specific DNA-methyltransferase (adenine-specific)
MQDWPDNCVDLVLTDPPYQLSTSSHYQAKLNPWADMCNSAFWFAELFRVYFRLLKEEGAIWQFLNWRSLPTIQKAAFDADSKIESLMVWDKIWIGPGGNRGLRPRYELIALLGKKGFSIEDRAIPDICQCLWASKPSGHPAEKPRVVCSGLIEISSIYDALILDPFCGSGTTCVAAKMLGRKYIGIDISEKYCQIARQRLEAVDTGVPVKEQNWGQQPLFGKTK